MSDIDSTSQQCKNDARAAPGRAYARPTGAGAVVTALSARSRPLLALVRLVVTTRLGHVLRRGLFLARPPLQANADLRRHDRTMTAEGHSQRLADAFSSVLGKRTKKEVTRAQRC